MGKYEERVRKFGANDGIIGEVQAADTEIERLRKALSKIAYKGGLPKSGSECAKWAEAALKGENHD